MIGCKLSVRKTMETEWGVRFFTEMQAYGVMVRFWSQWRDMGKKWECEHGYWNLEVAATVEYELLW